MKTEKEIKEALEKAILDVYMKDQPKTEEKSK
jgi:hypothetical protein